MTKTTIESSWDLDDDSITLTTLRGTNESDESYLARHEAELTEALDNAVDPEDLESTVDDHMTEIEAELEDEGDAINIDVTLPPEE